MSSWWSGSSSSSSKKSSSKPKTLREEWLAKYEEQPVEVRLTGSLAVGAILGSFLTLGLVKLRRRFRRYPTHEWITPNLYERKQWLKGIVTSVGDPDGFRFYHTPVLVSYWRYWKGIPVGAKGLKDQTISVRLAGVDAPEFGHFNKESQPFAVEAREFLKGLVLDKVVYIQLLKRDQYARAVAAPVIPSGFFCRWIFTKWCGKSVADEMLRAGFAVTYQESGAVYGPGGLEGHLAIEAKAKEQKRGQWVNGTNVETPSEYKRRYRSSSPLEDPEIDLQEVAEAEKGNGSGKNGKNRRK